jgi:hypothetical protein
MYFIRVTIMFIRTDHWVSTHPLFHLLLPTLVQFLGSWKPMLWKSQHLRDIMKTDSNHEMLRRSCTETKSTSQRLEFCRRAHRGELEHFLWIVLVLVYKQCTKTPDGRILSGYGTNILSTTKSNLKTYQNCRNCEITTHNPFRKFENTSWREGRWTGEGNDMLPGDYRVFLVYNRQSKCLGADRQNNVWCLDEDRDRYLRNDEQNAV